MKENTKNKNEGFQGKGSNLHLIKTGIWIYFFLLLFEGALRKWFLPGLATPLLIIRDPIAAWVIILSIRENLIRANLVLGGVIIITVVSVFTALFLGHESLPVALFGARIFLLHFPLIFIIGRVFTSVDVVKIGKTLLWISIPMTIIIALQFYSPQSAWINKGVGAETEGAGFSGALGYFRPPGTFSFTTGTVSFYGLLACFIFYFWLQSKSVNKILLYAATAGLIAAIPLSISRTLFFSIIVTLIFTSFAASRNSKYFGQMLIGFVGMMILLIILSNMSMFQNATEAFTSRFEVANEVEGGLEGVLADRYLGGLISALQQSSRQEFFGYGIGMGTNVGSMLLTGSTKFLIAEGEWGRLIGELGPLLGIAIIFFRLKLSADIALASYSKIAKGVLLPWILLSYILLNIPQGQWAQPTLLGFSCIACGLGIAALKDSSKKQPVSG